MTDELAKAWSDGYQAGVMDEERCTHRADTRWWRRLVWFLSRGHMRSTSPTASGHRAEAAEDDLTIAVRELYATRAERDRLAGCCACVVERVNLARAEAAEAELRAAHQVLAIARNWRDQERTQPPTVGQILLFMAIAEHDAGRTA